VLILQNLTSIDAAYLAGLLDGEGSFMIGSVKQRMRDDGRIRFKFRGQVTIWMTHKPTVEFVSKIFGSRIIEIARHDRLNASKNYKNIFRATLCANRALEEFLQQILPYLKTKSEQCKLILELLQLQKLGRTRIEDQAELYRKVRNLNTEISDEVFRQVSSKLYRKIRKT
jgi:hypothetical protein